MDEFTREELQDICLRAESEAESVKNVYWQRAYRDLADDANALDAMEARTIEKDVAVTETDVIED